MSIPGLRRTTRTGSAPAPGTDTPGTEPRPEPVDEDVEAHGAVGPTVPRQRRRRDAYALYAEVYALRLDLDDD